MVIGSNVYASTRIDSVYFFGLGISKDKTVDLKIQAKIGMNDKMETEKQSLLRRLFPYPPTGEVNLQQLIYMLSVFERSLYTSNIIFIVVINQERYKDAHDSKKLTAERYQQLGLIIKLKEGVARLISPLL